MLQGEFIVLKGQKLPIITVLVRRQGWLRTTPIPVPFTIAPGEPHSYLAPTDARKLPILGVEAAELPRAPDARLETLGHAVSCQHGGHRPASR